MWLPDPPPAEQLRTLASIAMDAARAAGAEQADIRIGVQRRVVAYGGSGGPGVGMAFGYGVRAWHQGTWSFQHGNVLTPDAVAATARSAVAGARIYAGVNTRLASHRRASGGDVPESVEWAQMPVATGIWRMPVVIDPFTVPVDDYQRVLDSLTVFTSSDDVWYESLAHALAYALSWQAETRVFASTAGALVTQETMVGGISLQATATLPPFERSELFLHQPQYETVCGGFETALRAEIPGEVQRLYDTAVRWEELPFRQFQEVGRFPVVFDGTTMAGIIGSTIGRALDGDRVSGIEADASGGSFLAPAEQALRADKPQFSPLLGMTSHRQLPSPMAVRWDDDGVMPEPYTLLERGRVVDFHTTRETAPILAAWYAQHGRPLRSHGGALASTPASVPLGCGGHSVVAAASGSAGVEDLMREISHGFLLVNGAVGASPGLTTGVVSPRIDGFAVEIRHGVPVSRTNLNLQFATQPLLNKNLVALGDAGTVRTTEVTAYKGIPWQPVTECVTAPAALCNDVDVTLV